MKHYILFYNYDSVEYLESFLSGFERDIRINQLEGMNNGLGYLVGDELYTRIQSLDVK